MKFGQLDNKISLRFFDKTFPSKSHHFVHKNLDSPPCSVEVVKKNCSDVVKDMNGIGLVVLRQIHSNIVHLATHSTEYGLEPTADASVTNVPGLILGIQTADCVPVLFACKSGKVIGAAHCGWPGTKLNIINEVILQMGKLGAQDILALIGPSIKQDSYEVREDYRNDFITHDLGCSIFFKEGKTGYYFFDLPSYVEYKLKLAGVEDITIHPDDTYSMENKYYSWRRCCHKNIPYEGNLLSTIMIK